ncbi:hypothetical protein BDD43_1560 [Mucilaginibacter gracilis]|uniref:Uncharacterized protein n=1 Tax=Mucilaginibacter gracilis TaxID=423350 RepID=A0A495IZG7_9SPHI|nr:hypothetical protein [Mucilaginibacter gracilis]RKR81414.1 hypothetical protein BDD43_1560 [Mucilaginibacter gracilis]
MKTLKLSLIGLIAIVLTACHSPQKDSESATKDYIKAKLNDPSSYEPVSFSKIDTVYTTFETTTGKEITKSFDDLVEEVKANNKTFDNIKEANDLGIIKYDWYHGSKFDIAERKSMDSLLTLSKALLGKAELVEKKKKEMEASFKKQPDGFSLIHSFRAKNALGVLMLDKYKVTLNKKFEVIGAETIE